MSDVGTATIDLDLDTTHFDVALEKAIERTERIQEAVNILRDALKVSLEFEASMKRISDLVGDGNSSDNG